jgi:hypothetical protein
MQRKKKCHTLLGGIEISPASVEISMEVPQESKIELSYDSSLSLLGI